MTAKDWLLWHRHYDEPGTSLQLRLDVVQRHIRRALDDQPPGPIRVVSMCAGQGRDLIGAVSDHPRRRDVNAVLVELDPRNVDDARTAASGTGLTDVDVVKADASCTTSYHGAVPANLVLVCGVFGNITEDAIRTTINELPHLCAPAATVIWTRYPREPELLPQIDQWFNETGFEPIAIETGAHGNLFGVGTHRLVAPPQPFRSGVTMFCFLEHPDPTGTGSGSAT